MPIGLPAATMSASEYLRWEQNQELRHEFLAGEVFVMAAERPWCRLSRSTTLAA
jgi:hypothetical protein